MEGSVDAGAGKCSSPAEDGAGNNNKLAILDVLLEGNAIAIKRHG